LTDSDHRSSPIELPSPVVSTSSPAGPLDVTAYLAGERAALVELLASLDPSEWASATECPAWSVKGVALHLLGDDLSLLSRQRDDATNSLELYAEQRPGLTFPELLNGFNDQWVEASRFLSEALIIEMLRLAGTWSADFYHGIDLGALGEAVGYFGATEPSPYWQITAREYMERWEHHHQIRRAVVAPELGGEYLAPAAAVAVRHFVARLPELDAPRSTSVTLEIPDSGVWTMRRTEDSWTLLDGAGEASDAALILDPERATVVLSRGLHRAEVTSAFTTSGDATLAERAVGAIAAMTSRDSRAEIRPS
jgi:uncharacterized protein (TIGR03083 family)